MVGVSSMEIRNRYGAPNMERFTARPGIEVTVEYGADRLACDMVLEAPRPLVDTGPFERPQLIPSEAVSEILEEVAPVAIRGKQINQGGFQSGCNAVVSATEYENVVISRLLAPCDSPSRDQEVRATVSFKRDACPKHPPLFNTVAK
jgi:hypothetical protein